MEVKLNEIKTIKTSDLIQDDRNLNKGTERGRELIQSSVTKFGAGRSILIDKNNRIIAGNKTQEAALVEGINDVLVVETDGKKLVAVKRTDIDFNCESLKKNKRTLSAKFVVFVGKALKNAGGVVSVRTIEQELAQGAMMINKHGGMLKLQISRKGNGVRKNAVQFGIV